MGIPFTHASATIGGSRLLLNLRSAHYAGTQADTFVMVSKDSAGYGKSPVKPVKPLRYAPWRVSNSPVGGTSTVNERWGMTSTLVGDEDGHGADEDGIKLIVASRKYSQERARDEEEDLYGSQTTPRQQLQLSLRRGVSSRERVTEMGVGLSNRKPKEEWKDSDREPWQRAEGSGRNLIK